MYFSSSNCEILIGNQPAVEVVGINVSETEQVLPIYGWRQREWDHVGKGQIMVTGSVIYNARVPNYVERLVLGNSIPLPGSSEERDLAVKEADLLSRLETLKGQTEIGETDPRVLLEVARLNKKYNYSSGRTNYSNNTTRELPYLSDIETEIEINHMTNGTHDVVTNVVFNSKATEVQGGSAGNIKYAHGFIAKRFKSL